MRLYPGERLSHHEYGSFLCYERAGGLSRPLVVFVPGAGHLARVAYGHPSGEPADFLDHWLARLGYGLLAVSYPSDNAVFDGGERNAHLTVRQWADATAAATIAALGRSPGTARVVLAAWSMGGRVVSALGRALAEARVDVGCVVSLAATAPLPGLGACDGAPPRLSPDGFWDHAPTRDPADSRCDAGRRRIRASAEDDGREVIPSHVYAEEYTGRGPLALRGDGYRLVDGTIAFQLEETMRDLGSSRYADFPLVGSIVPTDASDARHALTDRATWGFYNAQSTYARCFQREGPRRALTPETWRRLSDLVSALPERLTRFVHGGHLFFVGQHAARLTALHLSQLETDIDSINAELARLMDLPRAATTSEPEAANVRTRPQ